ncbi:phosphatidylinositol 3 and 4-kinase-domain-containing protein [Fomitopsis serialis]|uniref:phosphatidylinositol 3 and 4-kinase-domain-containing protein n=1 Tax=Fomitopsis serialis TaxID=139415 RepID=UPI00200732AF|nr:phosphatidylinositol 3 and 4-kinase-domain-containing protein [Neoantrodia serialis]KAH9935586.1 phosphatidylinositol 3 and 4-kinase-domain-containing protein [Neoantrodia serialis]
MPNRSEYQPLSQGAEDEEEADVVEGLSPAPRPSPRQRRPGHIDLSKLDTAFKRWTESIAQKVKRRKKVEDNSRKEIFHSAFEPAVVAYNVNTGPVMKDAIADGIHPKMITKGSSGSYFARAKVDGKVQTVAVFKPKDEEPYGRLNPKTTKWLHRQFKWIIPFGRACLIPNLSYISEAAASLLDERLNLNIVPRTQLVSLSSPAFFYDWLDRQAAKKGKPLPEKIGSMQYFLNGFTDASEFLRRHPWPGRAISDTFDDSNHRKGSWSKKLMLTVKIVCGRTGDEEHIFDEDDREDERYLFDVSESRTNEPFHWTPALQDSFREELENESADYLMLNTDRGADNYMIKYCDGEQGKMPQMAELRRTESGRSTPQMSTSTNGQPYVRQPHIHIAAIDNSLSFPHEHPRGWRSYTYGWLYLPVSIIGRPFSQETRDHFLPLLTSKAWWAETTYQLRKLFAVDPDFHPKMFNRQLAVVKGQAWNIVQALRHAVRPLELTRRQKVLVWDDELEVTDEMLPDLANVALPSPHLPPQSPHASVITMPVQKHARSHSSSDFPPPMRRVSSENSGVSRPVPFAKKFTRHMERLDEVEAGLKRIGVEDEALDEDVEVDVGEMASSVPTRPSNTEAEEAGADALSPSAPSERLPAVPEDALSASMTEEDLVAMSKSLPQLDISPGARHSRWPSMGGPAPERPSLDWIDSAESPKPRTVISERLETVNTKPFFDCW